MGGTIMIVYQKSTRRGSKGLAQIPPQILSGAVLKNGRDAGEPRRKRTATMKKDVRRKRAAIEMDRLRLFKKDQSNRLQTRD